MDKFIRLVKLVWRFGRPTGCYSLSSTSV